MSYTVNINVDLETLDVMNMAQVTAYCVVNIFFPQTMYIETTGKADTIIW